MPIQSGIIRPVGQGQDPLSAMREGQAERRAVTLQELSIERQKGLIGREKAGEARTEEKFGWEQQKQARTEQRAKLEDISLMNDEARNVYDTAIRVYKSAKSRGLNELQANQAANEAYQRKMAPLLQSYPDLAEGAPQMFEIGEFKQGVQESMTHDQALKRELQKMGMEDKATEKAFTKKERALKLRKGEAEIGKIKATTESQKALKEYREYQSTGKGGATSKDRFKRIESEVKRLTKSYEVSFTEKTREEIEMEALENVESMESIAAGRPKVHKPQGNRYELKMIDGKFTSVKVD